MKFLINGVILSGAAFQAERRISLPRMPAGDRSLIRTAPDSQTSPATTRLDH